MRLKYGAKEFAFEIKEWEVDKIGKSRREEAYMGTGGVRVPLPARLLCGNSPPFRECFFRVLFKTH